MLIGPLVAPSGTTAVMRVDDSTVNEAAAPLKLTRVVPVKLVPVMMMLAPNPA
jgi:hypothetical protein